MPELNSVKILTVFAVLFLGAEANLTPGVVVVNRTVSCCEKLEILLEPGCEHTIESGGRTVSRVWLDSSDQGPFQHLMKHMECGDFTHKSACPVGVNGLREVITHFRRPPCTKDSRPNAAPDLHGSLLYLLLALAMKMFL